MITKEQCEQALRNLETINLDIVLDELGYEKAEQVSWYGMNDYPTLEKQGDIDVLRELIEEHFDKETQKKPKGISVTHEGRVGNCPSCGKFIREEQNKHFCDCGQKIDWREYETD